MALWGRAGRNGRVLGVHAGPREVAVALVRHGRDGVRVERLVSSPLPPEVWDGERLASPEALGAALARLLLEQGVACRAAVAALPLRTAPLRRLSLPGVRPRELPQAVRWEMQRAFPGPVEEASIAYATVRGESRQPLLARLGKRLRAGRAEPAEPGEAQLAAATREPPERGAGRGREEGAAEVMAAAAPAEAVGAWVAALRLAGLEPLAVEVEPLALWRLARHLRSETHPGGAARTRPAAEADEDKAEAVLHIDVDRSTLVLSSPRDLYLARPLPVDAGALAHALSLRTRSAAPPAPTAGDAFEEPFPPGGPSGSPHLPGTDPVDELTAELNRSLRFFNQRHPGRRVSRIRLTGAGATLPGLAGALADALDLEVAPLDLGPLAQEAAARPGSMGVARGASQPARFALALGLAMRPADRVPWAGGAGLDLAAPQLPSLAERRRRLGRAVLASLLALDLLGLSGWVAGQAALGRTHARLAALRAAAVDLRAEASLAQATAALRDRERRLEVLSPVGGPRPHARTAALTVQRAPADVTPTQVSVTASRLQITGTATRIEALAAYVDALQAVGDFVPVRLRDATRTRDGTIQFTLSAEPGRGPAPAARRNGP